MRRTFGQGAAGAPLENERERVLRAVDASGSEAMTGPKIFERALGDSPASDTEIQPGDQSLLYPALHSLEADWKVQAEWVTDADGVRHRTYRKRRLLPHR